MLKSYRLAQQEQEMLQAIEKNFNLGHAVIKLCAFNFFPERSYTYNFELSSVAEDWSHPLVCTKFTFLDSQAKFEL